MLPVILPLQKVDVKWKDYSESDLPLQGNPNVINGF